MIEAWNKLDRVDEDRRAALVAEADRRDDVVALSALTGEGLERLITAVADRLTAAARVHRIPLSPSDGEDLAWLRAHGTVVREAAREDGKTRAVGVRLSDAARRSFEARLGARSNIRSARALPAAPPPATWSS